MHAYVINLARSPERRETIIANLEKCRVDYEIVTAIDKLDFPQADPCAAGKVVPSFWDRAQPGEVACTMSHMIIYRKIIDDGLEQALVLEDDVILPEDLSAITDAAGKCLEGPEVALLNFDSEEIVQVSRLGSIDLPSDRKLVFPVHAGQLRSAAAYIITREACVQMIERAWPIRINADNWLRFVQAGCIEQLRCVFPLAVRKHPGFRSTVDHTPNSRSKTFKGVVFTVIDRWGLRWAQGLITRRRERFLRRHTRVEFVDEAVPARSAAPSR